MKTILVKFKYALMRNEENEYCVYQYIDLSGKGKVTCVGYNLPSVSIPYKFTVEEVNHPKYGTQYKVSSYEERIGSDEDSIVEYLGCGLFRGLGKVTAKRVYEKFGADTLNIFHNHIDRLIEVKGISKKSLSKIKESYSNNMTSREVQQYLIPYGFTVKQIAKICSEFPDDTINTIKENPYVLCKISGITFHMVDGIGTSLKFQKNDPKRLLAALFETLFQCNRLGPVGVPTEMLLQNLKEISGIYDKNFLWKFVLKAVEDRSISYIKKNIDGHVILYFYLNHIYSAEISLADQITRLNTKQYRKYDNLNAVISDCCIAANIILDESQFLAIRNTFLHGLTIITGGPGTGKTTISKIIIMVQNELKKKSKIELLAPTGRAARRMTECMELPARTIHSRLELGIHGDTDILYTEKIEDPIDCDLLIVDEFSMVDMMLAQKLFSSIKNGRVVLVGDKDQLASVGAGNVLKDMLESGVVPVSYLEYEHRQSEDSVICENAHNMQKNIWDLKEGADFHTEYTEKKPCEALLKTIEDRIVEQYLKDMTDPSINSLICLSPYKEYASGVYSLNRRLQDSINPLNGRMEVQIPNNMTVRAGDIVMHLQNNDEVCNGDIGTVNRVCSENGSPLIYVDYSMSGGPKDFEYTRDAFNTLTLAYAMTVHKAQGAEYDSVITCMTQFHKRMLKRNILYTGITRAKKKVTCFFDSVDTVKQAVNNVQCEERYTLLSYWLKQYAKPEVTVTLSKNQTPYEQLSLSCVS